MQDFKIKNFQNDHPGITFPEYWPLANHELLGLQDRVRAKLGLPNGISPLDLVNTIDCKSQIVSGFNADADDFTLNKILDAVGVPISEYILVNWYRFDEVDRMRLHELNEHFGYICYSGPDDIDIFPDNLSWILSVAHDGYLKLLNFSDKICIPC